MLDDKTPLTLCSFKTARVLGAGMYVLREGVRYQHGWGNEGLHPNEGVLNENQGTTGWRRRREEVGEKRMGGEAAAA